MPRTRRMKDGEAVALRLNEKFRFGCCDCGLVHDMVIVTHEDEPGIFGFAIKRNNRATAAMRREKKQEP